MSFGLPFSLFYPRGISKAYYEEASRKRQAIRFTLNGYDYGVIAKMFMMATKEIKYKKKNHH